MKKRDFLKYISLCYLLALVVLINSCTRAGKAKEPPADNLAAQLDALFNEHIEDDEPGAAVMVVYDGKKVYSKGFGKRDVDAGEPITATTNMRMASLSKQFTALCILSLVDQGKLKLSDEASTYLPYPIFEGMTVEHLANHTSGLPDYYSHFSKNWNEDNILENKDVLDWLATSPEANFAPGTSWEYSNTAYLMLALIVQKVSGMEFSAYAKANVFEKAGMAKTNYYNLAKPIEIPERAYCYEIGLFNSVKQVDGYFMNGVMGDGAVYTSLNDYYNYDQALRNKSILSEETHALIFKPSSEQIKDSKVVSRYAMGWGVNKIVASHSGGWIGTNTYVKRYLNKPLTWTIFMNRDTMWKDKLVEQMDSLVNHYME